ncbi:hypothetical protein LINPERPRIM_LOCUS626 [Linum perenne]
MISIDPELKEELCDAWKNAIIIKVYGKSMGYFYLLNRLQTILRLEGEMEFLDVGCSYFVAKFSSRADWLTVISGGPYLIVGCFLALRQWSPDFVPSTERVSSIVALIRFAELPLEYYSDGPLFQLAACMVKPLRIDTQTLLATRGKFVPVCVELNLDEPLMPVVGIEGRWYKVEYEGISNICTTYGCAGHNAEHCLIDIVTPSRDSEILPMVPTEVAGKSTTSDGTFGDRMVVQSKAQKRKGPCKAGNNRKDATAPGSGANRFVALEAEPNAPESPPTSMVDLHQIVVEEVMEDDTVATNSKMSDNSCPNPLYQAETSVAHPVSPLQVEVGHSSQEGGKNTVVQPELPSIQKSFPGIHFPSKSDSETKKKNFEDLTNRQRAQTQSTGKKAKGDKLPVTGEGRVGKPTKGGGRAVSRSRTPPRRNL